VKKEERKESLESSQLTTLGDKKRNLERESFFLSLSRNLSLSLNNNNNTREEEEAREDKGKRKFIISMVSTDRCVL